VENLDSITDRDRGSSLVQNVQTGYGSSDKMGFSLGDKVAGT
jgi:hypothetical protein